MIPRLANDLNKGTAKNKKNGVDSMKSGRMKEDGKESSAIKDTKTSEHFVSNNEIRMAIS